MTATAPRVIPPDILVEAHRSLFRAGVRYVTSERAYRRWRHREQAEACRFGGLEAASEAIDCRCAGCVEKLCFFYFDQVLLKFGVTT